MSPRCILCHRRVLGMIERSNFDPDVLNRVEQEWHRSTAVGAEASRCEVRCSEVFGLAFRKPKGRPWKSQCSTEKSSICPLANRAMAIVAVSWGLIRLEA